MVFGWPFCLHSSQAQRPSKKHCNAIHWLHHPYLLFRLGPFPSPSGPLVFYIKCLLLSKLRGKPLFLRAHLQACDSLHCLAPDDQWSMSIIMATTVSWPNKWYCKLTELDNSIYKESWQVRLLVKIGRRGVLPKYDNCWRGPYIQKAKKFADSATQS